MQPVETLKVLLKILNRVSKSAETNSVDVKKAYLKQKESYGKEVTILKTKKRGRPKVLPEEIVKKLSRQSSLYNLKMNPSVTI